ncbi:MAG: hypothetical protein M4579_005090 [Chaenotheca gracillima]|nr:MAG: hypothetical protein M4579_005090 [Chaenotheca gracillima]
MKFSTALVCLAVASNVSGLSLPGVASSLSRRDPEPDAQPVEAPWEVAVPDLNSRDLEKRRGGGGGGGGGRGGGSSGGSSSGSSGGSSSGGRAGSGGASSGAGSPSRSYSTNSNLGGATRSGSGARPVAGGYYAGGARRPYTAGGRSPAGLTPFLLPVAALGVFPGLWLYGAYSYHYSNGYNYRNNTARRNETLPVQCLCQQYSVCGCDDDKNMTSLNALFKDPDHLNASLVRVGDVNGTRTIVLNGTLPNGTTASGGTDPSSADEDTSSATRFVLESAGWWVSAAAVASIIFLV